MKKLFFIVILLLLIIPNVTFSQDIQEGFKICIGMMGVPSIITDSEEINTMSFGEVFQFGCDFEQIGVFLEFSFTAALITEINNVYINQQSYSLRISVPYYIMLETTFVALELHTGLTYFECSEYNVSQDYLAIATAINFGFRVQGGSENALGFVGITFDFPINRVGSIYGIEYIHLGTLEIEIGAIVRINI